MDKAELVHLYAVKKLSAQQIADVYKCSANKVTYWLEAYNVRKRTISEAIYCKCNHGGDPFSVRKPATLNVGILFGLGLGLYWGEGTRSSVSAVRLGNSDPDLIRRFMQFLETFYDIRRSKLKFGLQIFGDINERDAQDFWITKLKINKHQFQKTVVSELRGKGTYKKKSKYGVLTLHYNNKKLRNIVYGEVEKLR